jgi:cytosine permease
VDLITQPAGPDTAGPSVLPRALREALAAPALERKSWQWTVAPTYIGLFLWVVYFDQLGRKTLSVGGLGWSVLGAAAGAVLCTVLLYHVPAMWGHRTGRPLTVLGASTFGARGSVALLVAGLGLAQVVWLAVSTLYAVDWTFQGLSSLGLLNLHGLKRLQPGAWLGLSASAVPPLRSPLFLITSLCWICWAVLVGHYLVRIIAALMNVYPIFPALMLGTAMLLTLKGVPDFRPLAIDPASAQPVQAAGPRAFTMMIQMIFGFFATAGLAGADWGTVCRTPRDVRLGGWVGVGLASWVIATLALLTVAGALGQFPAPPGLSAGPGVGNFSFRVALLLGVPERLAGAMFLVFGLASLAPTCYAAFVMGHRLTAVWPGVSRLVWTLLGTAAAWTLVATGAAIRLEEIFTLLGALFAPMAGAMAADYVRSRGAWPGIRPGYNPSGMAAWAVGVAVGLVPLLGLWTRWTGAARFQPASVYGFVAAFLVASGLARLGLERPAEPVPVPVAAPMPEAEAEEPEPVPPADGPAVAASTEAGGSLPAGVAGGEGT